jgi:hypothetical protein
MITVFSDCTVSVIQILDDADVAFRISGIADRSIRDHHARRQATASADELACSEFMF